MNNVFQLFGRKKTAAATELLTSSSPQLDHAIKELYVGLDAIEHVVDEIDDTEIRTPLKQTTKQNRDALSGALLKLSEEITKLAKAANAIILK
jgi:hypothetical protein